MENFFFGTTFTIIVFIITGITVFVLITRWVLRINDIITNLEDIKELLKNSNKSNKNTDYSAGKI